MRCLGPLKLSPPPPHTTLLVLVFQEQHLTFPLGVCCQSQVGLWIVITCLSAIKKPAPACVSATDITNVSSANNYAILKFIRILSFYVAFSFFNSVCSIIVCSIIVCSIIVCSIIVTLISRTGSTNRWYSILAACSNGITSCNSTYLKSCYLVCLQQHHHPLMRSEPYPSTSLHLGYHYSVMPCVLVRDSFLPLMSTDFLLLLHHQQ